MPVLHTPAEDVEFYTKKVFSDCQIWMTEDPDGITGFVAFREGWLEQLYVHPRSQGKGVGTALLKIAQRTPAPLRLWTFQCNDRAQRFYERHGFRVERETDGADNEEQQPDILYLWEQANENPIM